MATVAPPPPTTRRRALSDTPPPAPPATDPAQDDLLAGLAALPVPAFVVDVRGDGVLVLAYLNPAHRAATGLAADPDRPMRDLVPPQAFALVAARYRAALEADGPTTYTEHLELPAGPRWWRTTLRALPDDGSGTRRIVGVGVDITSLVEGSDAAPVREELEARLRELRRTNAELDRFAAVASHDLQAPLRRVITLGDRLAARAGDALDPRSRDYLDRMQAAAAGASRLIRDLLTLSRAGGAPPVLRIVDLDAVVDEVLPLLPAEELTVHRPAPLPSVRGEAAVLRRILQNLLHNAAEHGARDGGVQVWVEARTEADTAGTPWVILSVRDDGPGFPAAEAERILAPFVQLRRGAGGSGIGLAIASRLAASLGGRLTALAPTEGGACFTLRLPAAGPAPG